VTDTSPESRGAHVNGVPPEAATTRASGRSRLVPVSPAEALRLIGSVPFGRIVFTEHALPAIRPVNHVYNGRDIIIRTHEGTALTNAASAPAPRLGVVVAYEADQIDPRTRVGWSVVVTGYAKVVADLDEIERYMAMVQPWVEGWMDVVVRISPDLVTGYRLESAD
jgi:nitroimidazol reductase NimA-like FMN-containing flavoprotein (pyridoxamine 5'-phosphate oxidase superfamily)